MTDNYFLSKDVKIRVPQILDDPLYGRILAVPLSFPLKYFFNSTDYEYIIIKEGKLILQGSTLAGRKAMSFQLKNIDKLILRQREISCFDREGKLKFPGRSGIEMELSLVDVEGKDHVIIPIFLTNSLGPFMKTTQKNWERFLRELQMHSGLPIEETSFS